MVLQEEEIHGGERRDHGEKTEKRWGKGRVIDPRMLGSRRGRQKRLTYCKYRDGDSRPRDDRRRRRAFEEARRRLRGRHLVLFPPWVSGDDPSVDGMDG